MAKIIASHLRETSQGRGPVSTRQSPAELAQQFRAVLPQQGVSWDAVLDQLKEGMSESTRLTHPMYMGHQVCAPLPMAVWVESLIAAMNQSMPVWEMSPVATIIENQVLRWMADLAGFGPSAGGVITSGATEATFTALLAARARLIPDAWTKGVGSPLPLVLCGAHAHYCVARAVAQLGLGTDQVVTVPSKDLHLDPSALDTVLTSALSAGQRVLAVVATSGCAPTGSFDDLETIGRICESHRVWLHVDGAHGASSLMSPAHAHRMRGVARADSLAWDPHKMMSMPLQTGILLIRNEKELEKAFAQTAPYLFQPEGSERSWDQGKRSFQCSRRADALKLWACLKRYGASTFGILYEHLCSLAQSLHHLIELHPDFEAIHRPETNILCFRFLKAGLNPTALDAFNLNLREKYNRGGRGWITTTLLDQRRVLRVALMNPRTEMRHLQALLDGLLNEAAA